MEHTTIGQVASWLDATFHPELQEDYDNAGFLIGQRQEPCTGILVALDLTPAVADEAIEQGLNLIVTHHPFIFGGLTRITSDGVENVGCYSVPEFDALIEKALSAPTFDERLAYFAQAEAYLLDNAFMIPVISSLRGYHMTYEIPHTAPRALYGSDRYKGIRVATTPLTLDEYNILDAAWESQRTAK